MAKAIDVIVTADFTGPKIATFENRAIVFLAHWIENAGNARSFPLHLACIGEPPTSVAWMAKRANAQITIHAPHPLAHQRPSLNKQRGFEIEPKTDYFLLLDTDVWVLSDFSDLVELGYTIAAAPDAKPRVPTTYWHEIYAAFGMSPPTERLCSIRGELGWSLGISRTYPGQEEELTNMFPYYNAGILYAPWSCNLSARWAENAYRIADLFSDRSLSEPLEGVLVSDQAAFALAVEQLKREGVPFTSLASHFHGTRHHLYADALELSDVKLYHAIGFARSKSHPFHYGTFLVKKLWREWRLQRQQHPILKRIGDFWTAHTTVTYPLVRRLYQTYKRQYLDAYSK